MCLLVAGMAAATPVQVAVWDPVQVFPAQADVQGFRLDLLYGCNRDVFGIDLGVANRATRDFGGVALGLLFNNVGLYAMTNVAPANAAATEETEGPTLLRVAGRTYAVGGMARGIQLAGAANIAVELNGAQAASLMNVCHRHMTGLQLALFGNVVGGNMRGLQVGMLGNQCRGRMTGLQVAGLFNESAWMHGIQLQVSPIGGNRTVEMQGLQVSLVLPGNSATHLNGAQIGIGLNRADRIEGLQLGLVNYARHMHGVQIGLLNIIRESALPVCPIVNASF